jgi:hypothetical protein
VLKRVSALVMVLFFISSFQAFAKEETIGHLFKGKPDVKIYIKEVTNESGSSQITPEAFKSILEKSLLARKAMTFRIVNTIAESDIQISAVIKKFQYLKRGPFKPSIGLETTLLDAAATMTENYVEMVADYIVTDTKTAVVLWKDEIDDYIKHIMTPEHSVMLICDKLSRAFIWKCFGKAKRGSLLGM